MFWRIFLVVQIVGAPYLVQSSFEQSRREWSGVMAAAFFAGERKLGNTAWAHIVAIDHLTIIAWVIFFFAILASLRVAYPGTSISASKPSFKKKTEVEKE